MQWSFEFCYPNDTVWFPVSRVFSSMPDAVHAASVYMEHFAENETLCFFRLVRCGKTE